MDESHSENARDKKNDNIGKCVTNSMKQNELIISEIASFET